MMEILSTDDVKNALANQSVHTLFLDVRKPKEFATEHIEGFINIPLNQLVHHLDEFKGKKIIISCFSGFRAKKAGHIISQAVPSATIVCFRGSLRAWEAEGNEVVGDATIYSLSVEQQFFGLLATILLVSTFFEWGNLIVYLVCSGLIFAAISRKCLLKDIIGKMPWNKRVFVGD